MLYLDANVVFESLPESVRCKGCWSWFESRGPLYRKAPGLKVHCVDAMSLKVSGVVRLQCGRSIDVEGMG